jgi:hypothetical protein
MKWGVKAILGLLLFWGILSTGLSWAHYFVYKDYLIKANVPCDPTKFSCFVGDGGENPSFYKEVEKPAYEVPTCNAVVGTCAPLVCKVGDTKCTETYCTVGAGTECSAPNSPS